MTMYDAEAVIERAKDLEFIRATELPGITPIQGDDDDGNDDCECNCDCGYMHSCEVCVHKPGQPDHIARMAEGGVYAESFERIYRRAYAFTYAGLTAGVPTYIPDYSSSYAYRQAWDQAHTDYQNAVSVANEYQREYDRAYASICLIVHTQILNPELHSSQVHRDAWRDAYEAYIASTANGVDV